MLRAVTLSPFASNGRSALKSVAPVPPLVRFRPLCREPIFPCVKRRGVKMSIRLFKLAPIALACALSLCLAATSGAAPLVASTFTANISNSAEDRQDAPTLAPEASADTAQDTNNNARTQKHENAFLRALAAPFRALARLFGGGKKSTQAKRTKNTTPAQQTQQATNTTQPPTVTETRATPNTQAATKPTKLAPQAQAEGAARATAPVHKHAATATPTPPPSLADAPAAVAPAQPEKFTPVPEGVALDPISQGRALLERGDAHAALAPLSIAAVTGPD